MRKTLCLCMVALLCFCNLSAQNPRKDNKIFDNKLTKQESEYLHFLYDYMPLSDLADYEGEFFLNQVRYAIKARETFSWGSKIPENIFKHFVLVYRVNNENLDTARMFMFESLKDRIKDMSMYDAALEVNHWCHERVNYKASDGRTSSPLATIRTSWGRCGEESTLTVTALRAVGLPARQCYTPRWAHTDDNHAWVEVWIDGKWHHLGACEPEPELDIAWFDAPAKRAMMVHTTVFGKYKGQEEKNHEGKLYDKINLLSNYAATKKLEISVKDENGKPVKDAQVSFGLYNYAEFYPIAKILTDANGVASLTTGLGDLMIWVKKDNQSASALVKAETDKAELVLQNTFFNSHTETFKICPPVAKQVKRLSGEKVTENLKRFDYEDSLREAYLKTFPRNADSVKRKAERISRNGLSFSSNEEAEKAEKLIDDSWGNYREIERVLASGEELSIDILSLLYEKDLRDVEADVVLSHLKAYKNYPAKEKALQEFVLNPRVQLEKITPYRGFLQKYFANQAEVFIANPQSIADWIKQNIILNNEENYYGVQISPAGILKLKQCDILSREIFFVTIARSFGIAARYDWAVGKAQYKTSSTEDWKYPQFEQERIEPMGFVTVSNSTKNKIKPDYYAHFTLQRLIGNEYKTLDFEYDPKFASFPETLRIAAGDYRLMSGNRDADGNIYVREEYFSVKENDTAKVEVVMAEIKSDLKAFGKVNLRKLFSKTTTENTNTKDIKYAKGLVLAITDSYSEPEKHLMADLELVKNDMETWGGDIVFATAKTPDAKLLSLYPNLPKQTTFVQDKHKSVQKQILKATGFDFSNEYPLLCFISKTGEIFFLSEGYRIGSGESLLKVIHQLNLEGEK